METTSGNDTDLPSEVIVQRAGEARTYSMSPTEEMRFLFSGAVGQPEFYDERVARGDGPPLHRHPWASWELVVEGELRVVVDDEELHVGEGDFFYTPPGAVHTYEVTSDRARIVGFNHPGGRFEAMTAEVAPMFLKPGGPDMAEVVRTAGEHGLEILGPPLSAPAGT